ncbi:MAG: DUF5615 family PIN-like protein, partial [Mesorhizobium sp.]|nr:DUF5615 family PIN-like protein [Mesorhizobium sp.]
MKIILDEGVPRALVRALPLEGLHVGAFPNDWKQLSNGALIERIQTEGFTVLITNDKNMRHQISLKGRSVAVVVLPTDRLPELRKISARIAGAAA